MVSVLQILVVQHYEVERVVLVMSLGKSPIPRSKRRLRERENKFTFIE